ncbi:hypothetical protein LRAMOSA10962 [Lichtheimia ramosa]|uniref:Uncharacterized protein n=1 Tax=Lichtheimia ramosa TaxID=688394 RepID=A0A077WSF8_9FUNG|nr:hypothetical protein LRAMOSA10962 [Lichtheimia ramosa]
MALLDVVNDRDSWALFFGYASIACWFVVFTPQLYENYRLKNTDGVSVQFLLLWIFGDIFNLLGVILEDLLVTMLLVAAYYLLADCLLMGQVLYYRLFSQGYCDDGASITSNETTHLLSEQIENVDEEAIKERAGKLSERTQKIVRVFILSSVVFMALILGVSAWYFFAPSNDPVDFSQWHLVSQLLGYASAILYCASRLPQIAHNFRKESVEGLSLWMFIFSVMGNLTYCISIFVKSMDRTYLLINYPWLLGSGGTLFFDFTIFFQFYIYKIASKK